MYLDPSVVQGSRKASQCLDAKGCGHGLRGVSKLPDHAPLQRLVTEGE